MHIVHIPRISLTNRKYIVSHSLSSKLSEVRLKWLKPELDLSKFKEIMAENYFFLTLDNYIARNRDGKMLWGLNI